MIMPTFHENINPENVNVNWKIILNWILGTLYIKVWIGF